VTPVRWDDLFDDLEAQLAELEHADDAGEIAERARAEVSKFRLVDRLRPAFGHRIAVTLIGGHRVEGTVTSVGQAWMLVREDRGPEVLLPYLAVASVSGLGSLTAVPGSEGKVAARLTIGHALRVIARDRAAVVVGLADGTLLTGTLDRVGADFFEMAEHPVDEARRPGAVAGVRTVTYSGLALVRRHI